MDAYPHDYVQHNLPFIVISGLCIEKELDPPPPVQDVLPGQAVMTIGSDLATVTGNRADELLQEFWTADATGAPWNGRGLNRSVTTHGFRIRAIGRNFQFPPKKADAPTTSVTTASSSSMAVVASTSWILHSPSSPLNPSSSIFPDGVIAPLWIAKHQHYVPSVFISFFAFTTDPITNSLHDNQLKTEINKIKGRIQKSGFRTKYAVILLGDQTTVGALDIEERLNVIRRSTGLDSKTSFFFLPPNVSQVERQQFVASILSVLQPLCVEYYRDLTKHARRKKGRGTVPPPTSPPTRGTSQTLSHIGWSIRYDFKLGVFAEFRQEMDAALRHYNFAMEGLFGTEGLFETTASWSPRWDEIRLLADTIAFRQIRCQLWNNHPTSAVQAWSSYRMRLKNVLDLRGKGTSHYGWQAWESTWCAAMAQLIQRAKLPIFDITEPASGVESPSLSPVAIYSPPEKQPLLGESSLPWEYLHHPGYWHKLSADHAKRRYVLARTLPEEDRIPPGMSPATKVSNRNQIYDQYLVPPSHEEFPLHGASGGFDHGQDISSKMEAALSEFKARGQHRKAEHLQLEIVRTLLHVRKFNDAFKVLRPLWESMSWRREGWWSLTAEVLWALHECALHVQDRETYVATEWELYGQIPGKTRYTYDFMKCLDAFPEEGLNEKVTLNLDMRERLSCLSITFAFSESEGRVGEPLCSQIVVTSNARSGSAPITLSSISYQLTGSLSEVCITHAAKDDAEKVSDIATCILEESVSPDEKPRWFGTSDLIILPGQSRVYNFALTFREAGDVDVTSLMFEISTERFKLVCSDDNPQKTTLPRWWIRSNAGVKARKLASGSGRTVHVLPKPPKMEISIPDMRSQYYTDEPITLEIEILNLEEEDTEAVLEVRLLGRSKDSLEYTWIEHTASSPTKERSPLLDGSTIPDLPGHMIGRLARNTKTMEKLFFTAPPDPADYVLEVKVLYHLLSDRNTPISKILVTDLIFNAPFEASFDLDAQIHPDPWPSYFKMPEIESKSDENFKSSDAFGIAQKWGLRAKVACFADERLMIKDLAIKLHKIHGGAACDISKEGDIVDTEMEPQVLNAWSFGLDIRKNSLEERRATALDTALNITWQRTTIADAPSVVSSLPIPRIQIPSSEPRVLASVVRSSTIHSLLHLDYTLENPTMHFLTFELTMEASETFGFSGPKRRTLHLLPVSRHTVRYNVLPLVTGAWITPNLKVMDRYFNKLLKVQATEGLRMDKKGIGIWVLGEGGDEGEENQGKGDDGGGGEEKGKKGEKSTP